MLAWVYLTAGRAQNFALAATAVDIAAISVLALLSGGAVLARAAGVLPRPRRCRLPPAPVDHLRCRHRDHGRLRDSGKSRIPPRSQPEAVRFIVTQAGFLAWVGVACVLLSMLLARRTELVARLGPGTIASALGRARRRAARAQGARRSAPRSRDPEPALGAPRARGSRRGRSRIPPSTVPTPRSPRPSASCAKPSSISTPTCSTRRDSRRRSVRSAGRLRVARIWS